MRFEVGDLAERTKRFDRLIVQRGKDTAKGSMSLVNEYPLTCISARYKRRKLIKQIMSTAKVNCVRRTVKRKGCT